MEMDEKINQKLGSLKRSSFRSKFRLSDKEINYIKEKGIETMQGHAADFIAKRLAPQYIPNDGKQTPMKGHPVFIAQHATGTCCRSCLLKWHQIPKGKELSKEESEYILKLIMKWLQKQMTLK